MPVTIRITRLMSSNPDVASGVTEAQVGLASDPSDPPASGVRARLLAIADWCVGRLGGWTRAHTDTVIRLDRRLSDARVGWERELASRERMARERAETDLAVERTSLAASRMLYQQRIELRAVITERGGAQTMGWAATGAREFGEPVMVGGGSSRAEALWRLGRVLDGAEPEPAGIAIDGDAVNTAPAVSLKDAFAAAHPIAAGACARDYVPPKRSSRTASPTRKTRRKKKTAKR